MTKKQCDYIRHRALGLGQERAALASGYSPNSAKVSASRNERIPAIRAAIDEARASALIRTERSEYETAQSYLEAVVAGTAPPDPVRVGAARAILPYQQARQRAPLKGRPPKRMDQENARSAEQALLDDWAVKAAAVRARLGGRK